MAEQVWGVVGGLGKRTHRKEVMGVPFYKVRTLPHSLAISHHTEDGSPVPIRESAVGKYLQKSLDQRVLWILNLESFGLFLFLSYTWCLMYYCFGPC